jgi:putative thioredoxin
VLGPVLEKLAGEAAGRWELAKVNTEDFPDLSTEYGIQGIPNVKLFVDGEVVNEFLGALPEPAVREWLASAFPSPLAAEIREALARLEAGAFAEAAARLRVVLAEEPGNGEARLALGRALLHTSPAEVSAVVAPLADDEERADPAAALQLLADFAERSGAPGGATPSPARERLAEAAAAVRTGDWAAALDAVIVTLRYRNDPAAARAREVGRAIFILLGYGHPVFERYHRAFSSALHV